MPTKVIDRNDATEFDQTNLDELQAALDRLTADIGRWHQATYCWIPGDGIDPLTQEHLKVGRYHDFKLSDEIVTALKKRWGNDLRHRYGYLPVANCGTAFCVAGDLAVHNGYTFIDSPFSETANNVVPTTLVPEVLVNGSPADDQLRPADEVAREVLNVSEYDAVHLFNAANSLFKIWAIGYGLTGGRLRLPNALPAVTREHGDSDIDTVSPAVDTPEAVRDAIMITLLVDRYWDSNPKYGGQRFWSLLDVDRIEQVLDEVTNDAEFYERFRVDRFVAVSALRVVTGEF